MLIPTIKYYYTIDTLCVYLYVAISHSSHQLQQQKQNCIAISDNQIESLFPLDKGTYVCIQFIIIHSHTVILLDHLALIVSNCNLSKFCTCIIITNVLKVTFTMNEF